MKVISLWKNWSIISGVISFAFVGVILILIGNFCGQQLGTWAFIIRDVGIAMLVAGILGVSIDLYLRQRIAEDVFKGAMGYILPEELRPEMEWVYKQNIIATSHVQNCELELLGNDLVTVKMQFNRILLNVSQETTKETMPLCIDEWFHHEGESHITEVGYKIDNGESHIIDLSKCKFEKYCLEIEPLELSIASKSSIETWAKFEEIKHISDEHFVTFKYATKNPLVTVSVPDGIDYDVYFGHRHMEYKSGKLGENQYRLDGTLLPGQVISIRWWKTEDSESWLKKYKLKTKGD